MKKKIRRKLFLEILIELQQARNKILSGLIILLKGQEKIIKLFQPQLFQHVQIAISIGHS